MSGVPERWQCPGPGPPAASRNALSNTSRGGHPGSKGSPGVCPAVSHGPEHGCWLLVPRAASSLARQVRGPCFLSCPAASARRLPRPHSPRPPPRLLSIWWLPFSVLQKELLPLVGLLSFLADRIHSVWRSRKPFACLAGTWGGPSSPQSWSYVAGIIICHLEPWMGPSLGSLAPGLSSPNPGSIALSRKYI